MLKLLGRNILRQKGRTALTLAAIGIGVASLILSGGFVEDILLQLRDATIRSQLGHLQIYKKGYFGTGGQRPLDFLIDDAESAERAIAASPGIAVRTRRLGFLGLINNGKGELPIIGEGVETEKEARIGSSISMLSGRPLTVRDDFGIIIGEGLASAMKIKVGDPVNLLVSTRDGAINTLEFKVLGIFRSLSKEYDARAVRVALKASQELTLTSGINAIVVLLENTDDTSRARAQISNRLPSELEVKAWPELADFYQGTVAFYERQFAVLQAIILVMVLLGVANSVNMTLNERTLEFGIIRALGYTGRHVFRLAVLETTLVGAIGSALGVTLGVVLALVISAIGIPMPPPPNSEAGFTGAIRIVLAILLKSFGLGVAASIVAALAPARHVSRLPLVDALRRGV